MFQSETAFANQSFFLFFSLSNSGGNLGEKKPFPITGSFCGFCFDSFGISIWSFIAKRDAAAGFCAGAGGAAGGVGLVGDAVNVGTTGLTGGKMDGAVGFSCGLTWSSGCEAAGSSEGVEGGVS